MSPAKFSHDLTFWGGWDSFHPQVSFNNKTSITKDLETETEYPDLQTLLYTSANISKLKDTCQRSSGNTTMKCAQYSTVQYTVMGLMATLKE